MARKRGGQVAAVARVVFELTEAKARVTHANVRLEKHGDEDRLATDIDLEYDTDNGVLAMFSPTLRSALYQRPTGAQQELPGTATPEVLTELKYPELGVLKWSAGELVGAELRFHLGLKESSHLVFGEAKIGKYKFDCKEGGTVTLRFQASVYPNEKQSGAISKLLLDKVCVVTVDPARATEEEPEPGEE